MGRMEITVPLPLTPSIMADGLNYSRIVEVSKRNLMTSAICDGEGHCFNQRGAMTASD